MTGRFDMSPPYILDKKLLDFFLDFVDAIHTDVSFLGTRYTVFVKKI